MRLGLVFLLVGCAVSAGFVLWILDHESDSHASSVSKRDPNHLENPTEISPETDRTESERGEKSNFDADIQRYLKRRTEGATGHPQASPVELDLNTGINLKPVDVTENSIPRPTPGIARSNPALDEEKDLDNPDEDKQPPRGLAGWVFDNEGNPVADLAVVAEPRRLAATGEQRNNGHSDPVSTRTDTDGFFAYQSLAAGDWALTTETTERYETATGLFSSGVDSAVLIVTEKANRRAVVHGYVENSNGGSLQGVRVLPVGQFENRALSNGQGRYEVTIALDSRGRSQVLCFTLEGFREHRLTVDRTEFEMNSEVVRNVLLEPSREKSTVSGLIVGEDGSPVHSAHIQLNSNSLGTRADAVSDRDGLFSMSEVEHADDYRLWVRPPSGYKDYLEEDLVVTGWVDLEIVLDTSRRANLEGQMVDPQGRPVPGMTLWLASSQPSERRNIPVTGDGAGRFVVDELPEGRVAIGTHAAPLYSFSGIQINPGEVNRVRLRLDFGNGRLAGFVSDSSGRPIAVARSELLWSTVENGVRSQSKHETVTDANGYFLFNNLGETTHNLTISAPGYRSARHQVETGANSIELTVQLSEIPE